MKTEKDIWAGWVEPKNAPKTGEEFLQSLVDSFNSLEMRRIRKMIEAAENITTEELAFRVR